MPWPSSPAPASSLLRPRVHKSPAASRTKFAQSALCRTGTHLADLHRQTSSRSAAPAAGLVQHPGRRAHRSGRPMLLRFLLLRHAMWNFLSGQIELLQGDLIAIASPSKQEIDASAQPRGFDRIRRKSVFCSAPVPATGNHWRDTGTARNSPAIHDRSGMSIAFNYHPAAITYRAEAWIPNWSPCVWYCRRGRHSSGVLLSLFTESTMSAPDQP